MEEEPEGVEEWFLRDCDDDEEEWTSARFERSLKGKARRERYDLTNPVCYHPGWINPGLEGDC